MMRARTSAADVRWANMPTFMANTANNVASSSSTRAMIRVLPACLRRRAAVRRSIRFMANSSMLIFRSTGLCRTRTDENLLHVGVRELIAGFVYIAKYQLRRQRHVDLVASLRQRRSRRGTGIADGGSIRRHAGKRQSGDVELRRVQCGAVVRYVCSAAAREGTRSSGGGRLSPAQNMIDPSPTPPVVFR